MEKKGVAKEEEKHKTSNDYKGNREDDEKKSMKKLNSTDEDEDGLDNYLNYSLQNIQQIFQSQQDHKISYSHHNQTNSNHGFHYLCLINNSTYTQNAYQVALSLTKKCDMLTCFHGYNHSLSIHQDSSPQSLFKTYFTDVQLHFPLNHYLFCWEYCNEHNYHQIYFNKLNEYIALCSEYHTNIHYIVLGYLPHVLTTPHHHRHPPHPHHYNHDSTSSISSIHQHQHENPSREPSPSLLKEENEVDYYAPYFSSYSSILKLSIPLIITKNNKIPSRREKKRYLLAVDETIASEHAFSQLVHLINLQDTLILFHIVTEIETNIQIIQIQNKFENKLNENEICHTQFHLIQQEMGVSVGDTIVNYVNENSVDFIVLGTKFNTAFSLPTIVEQVIEGVNTSIILYKS